MASIEKEIKSKFTSPQQKAHINLIYTHNYLENISSAVFKQQGVTMQQYNVLRILKGAFPDSKTPTQVKEVMLDKNPDLTRLIDRLVKKNLVVRKDCEKNRRQVNLSITKEGIDYLDKINPEISKATSFMQVLTNKEAETLSDLLDKLRT
jgi:DNA-binding MarR family transcriptional regulator